MDTRVCSYECRPVAEKQRGFFLSPAIHVPLISPGSDGLELSLAMADAGEGMSGFVGLVRY